MHYLCIYRCFLNVAMQTRIHFKNNFNYTSTLYKSSIEVCQGIPEIVLKMSFHMCNIVATAVP